MKNFKDYAVTVPGRYAAALDIPNLSTVSQLIAWLNDNPMMVLTSSPGAILQAGTKNNAENLNESQKDALMSTLASSTVDGLIERYTHGVAELNGMFENPSCGAFNARMLFTPTNTNALVAPVLTVGGEDYTICIKGVPVAVGYLVAGSSYLLEVDVDTKKANLVQLEITSSAIMQNIVRRVAALETISTRRAYLGRQVSVNFNTPTLWPVTKAHQIVYFTLIAASASVAALPGTNIDLSNSNDTERSYAVELYQDGGLWYMRSLYGQSSSDSVVVSFTEEVDTLTIKFQENIGGNHAVVAFTDVIL